jgi:hypothetical protein
VTIGGAVSDDEQHACAGQAFDEAVQEDLAVGVDPVQVVGDDEKRLDLALAEQETEHGLQRPLTAHGGGQYIPCFALDGDVQE